MTPTFTWLYGPEPVPPERCCSSCREPFGVGRLRELSYLLTTARNPTGCPFCPREES